MAADVLRVGAALPDPPFELPRPHDRSDAEGFDPSPMTAVAARPTAVTTIHAEETAAHGALEWHVAPCRQYVVTLTGTLRFTTRDGGTFVLAPGDVLLAEDTAGSGHRWELIDDQPWRRLYVRLA